ncbi:MAG TPA: AsmA-like C-terminal domain-containing protein, partial [Nitrospiria bacterium]|nr:AsmA-like C-terminal domain-containing protein [Nitrospiria bacterium]
ASLPSELTVQTPLVLSRTHLQWEKGRTTRVAGTAAAGQGPSVSYEVEQGSDRYAVKELRIQDKGSKATLTMNYENRILDLSFAGNLVPSTLNGFFEHEHFEFGWLQGDFKARIVLDHPTETTAKGTLTGERLVLPLRRNTPVVLERISLIAADQTLTLNPIVLAYGSYHHTVKGDLKAMENGWLLDLNSDGLEWEALQALLIPESTKTEGGESPAPPKPYFPARATLRLSTDYFSAGRWTARPARAEISFEPDRIRISMKEAVVCGVNLQGTVTITPGNLDLDFRPSATHQDVESNFPCLFGGDLRSTGTFDLSGSFSSHGTAPKLLNNLQGTVMFTEKKGRIYHGGVVVRVLQFLNVTDLLRGSFPDPEQNGVPYDSVTLQGNITKGFLKFKEMIFVSPLVHIVGNGSVNLPDQKIDITLLVAPFTTTDSVIKKIPILKDILGGSLVTIPVRVKGPFDKLDVKTMPPEAVGEGLAGMMKRTLQLPFKIIEPVIPGTKKKS